MQTGWGNLKCITQFPHKAGTRLLGRLGFRKQAKEKYPYFYRNLEQ